MAIKKIFQADEIRANQIGQQYTRYIAELNQKLFATPDWDEWSQIYRELSYWELQIDQVNDEGLRQTHFWKSEIAILNLLTMWNAIIISG